MNNTGTDLNTLMLMFGHLTQAFGLICALVVIRMAKRAFYEAESARAQKRVLEDYSPRSTYLTR